VTFEIIPLVGTVSGLVSCRMKFSESGDVN